MTPGCTSATATITQWTRSTPHDRGDPAVSAALRSRPSQAFGFAVPISVLGGLIGLGGAEFRLPVLAGALHYTARRSQACGSSLRKSPIAYVGSVTIRADIARDI